MPPALSDYDWLSDSRSGPDEAAVEERPGTASEEEVSQGEDTTLVEEATLGEEAESADEETTHRRSPSELSQSSQLQPHYPIYSLPKPQQQSDSRQKPRLTLPQTQKAAPSSKKRKRVGLLAGLNLDNIIASQSTPNSDEIEDSIESTAPTSAPTSSYNIRARSTPKSILYNQKYHPMDDVIRPSHAAHIRAEYECNSDSEATHHSSGSSSGSDSDANKRPAKKRKKSPRRGTRRTSRRINRDAFYNMSRHPQDSDLKQLEIESDEDSVASQHAKSDEIPVIEVGDSPESSNYDVEFDELMTAQHAGDTNPGSGLSTQSQVDNVTRSHSLDLFDDTGFDAEVEDSVDGEDFDPNSPTPRRRASRQSFIVHEETIATQLARERSLGQTVHPLHEEDQDKENEDPQLEDDDSIDRTIVETMEEYSNRQSDGVTLMEATSMGDEMFPMLDGMVEETESLRHVSSQTTRSAVPDYEDASSQVSTPRVVLGDITSLT
ncbi:hypothetical protein DM02DRAFT_725608 [Periconia macrospinosa]|uniref:Uncharacterized protein n=1 Tax=Periconia macrospinosa TaxID=97972 RepID=A0A2V1E4R2_9PLEO|nr:hypothetical protein DM02DRAFT_725608 [Periconia macrospinosa]